MTLVVRPGSERNESIYISDRTQVVECKLAELQTLSGRLPHQYDVFFHLGWETASREIASDPLAQTLSILYTLDAVQLAHDLGCEVFVGAGSQSEYGREGLLTENTPATPKTSYGISKYAAGKLSRQLCEVFCLRSAALYIMV